MICRCASTMAASSAGTGPGCGGEACAGEADADDETAAFAGFAEPAAAPPGADAGVTRAVGLADALAAGGDGERPQPLNTPATTATPTMAAMAGAAPGAFRKRAFANRFIREMVTVRAVGNT